LCYWLWPSLLPSISGKGLKTWVNHVQFETLRFSLSANDKFGRGQGVIGGTAKIPNERSGFDKNWLNL
jgi:hypothetical protein